MEQFTPLMMTGLIKASRARFSRMVQRACTFQVIQVFPRNRPCIPIGAMLRLDWVWLGIRGETAAPPFALPTVSPMTLAARTHSGAQRSPLRSDSRQRYRVRLAAFRI